MSSTPRNRVPSNTCATARGRRCRVKSWAGRGGRPKNPSPPPASLVWVIIMRVSRETSRGRRNELRPGRSLVDDCGVMSAPPATIAGKDRLSRCVETCFAEVKLCSL